ncbi:MAG: hypothetical protein KatS3mg033_0114 [Thermonema sp.]|uniref:ABC transporter substrate-binding protein n=1 Tax=Thermonema sp. TaxID=2231181 RepID=UPI0021DDEB2A|nr:ABC transporter substrate-binding protein [Thermonema sp.]GIV38314.1 MAG: hypothetical protein KatS3mg033_0114 [Thermonema sp.]
MKHHLYHFALCFLSLLGLWQCTPAEKPTEQQAGGDSLPSVDIRYAHFQIESVDSQTYLLSIGDSSAGQERLRYVLSYRTQVPAAYRELPFIQLPLQHIGVRSTTHIGFLRALGVAQPPFLSAIPDTAYVFDASLRQMAAEGKLFILQDEALPLEAVAQHCQLLLVSAPLKAAEKEKLARLGVHSIPILEWMETHPLAQAEWIKLFGVLSGKLSKAQQYFEQTAQAYQHLRDSVARHLAPNERPLVITGLPFRGQWYVAGGQSFMAQFIQDAGGKYYWQSTPQAGSLPVAFEEAYRAGMEADVWLHPGQARSREEIAAADPRLQDFKAWQTGRVYNRTRRLSPAGGNDYWEQGVVEPHIILADMVKALHPYLLPAHRWKYYEQLP